MEVSGAGKSPNSNFAFRYNANNEELEELFNECEDDPPTPVCEVSSTSVPIDNASPKKTDKTSILDKYFKSIRTDKVSEKEDIKVDSKDEARSQSVPKDVTSSPMKDYLNRLGKRGATPEGIQEPKEANETWKIFHDFKFKIAQAVEDMKTKSQEETREKSVPRENSTSDSEENSAIKDSDPSIGDTDYQVSSLDSSLQNLSEMTQPITAKANEKDGSADTKNNSDSSNDTDKNLVHSDSAEGSKDLIVDADASIMEVESGVEAFEDTNLGEVNEIKARSELDGNTQPPQMPTLLPPPTPANGFQPSNDNLQKPLKEPMKKKTYFFTYSMYFLTFLVFLNYLLFHDNNVWNGFVLGLWFFCLFSNLKGWVLDNFFTDIDEKGFIQINKSAPLPMYTIPSVKEHTPLKKYEGWINHYRGSDYDPFTYHINKTTTAFMKLQGSSLRISYTTSKIAKRALWDEKLEKISFYQHRFYNLTGARVILLPKGLVKKRQWSKKYPICIILSESETIQVLEKENLNRDKDSSEQIDKKKETKHDVESETSASPEKKKYIWSKKEKSIAESEPSRDGLRRRIVKKIQRDKKTDSVSTSTDAPELLDKSSSQPEDAAHCVDEPAKSTNELADDDVDDTELGKIKEFLEEAESETGCEAADGEWTVHVKRATNHHTCLFLFGRTGRDKLEWFRRLNSTIGEAQAQAAECSPADDKSVSDVTDAQDGVQIVYKVSEKDTVAFGKTNKSDPISDHVPITPSSKSSSTEIYSYEKSFWPYFLKIIESHETSSRQTSDVSVMCQIEPSPPIRAKKKKKVSKATASECQCRMLPAEVTWLNTVLARMSYDVMRDPVIIAKLQTRIQRKLHTLKLPSFMSPLAVTELVLAGACPLVARVAGVTWDERGLWLDLQLRYDGGASIAILTQINLLKLKEKNTSLEDQLLTDTDNIIEQEKTLPTETHHHYPDSKLRKRKPAIYDSEVEDSAESSSDDESPPLQPVDSTIVMHNQDSASTTTAEGGSSKKKFLRMVDKIATNKYFQQVTDYKYVKRAMEGLSNTDLKLLLEIHGLEGILTVNLPPPPHDRIWIGFRTNPHLVLKARPAVGARTLRFAHISNWIEQKLSKEFEKVLVLPNMEDIPVDIMTPTPVDYE